MVWVSKGSSVLPKVSEAAFIQLRFAVNGCRNLVDKASIYTTTAKTLLQMQWMLLKTQLF